MKIQQIRQILSVLPMIYPKTTNTLTIIGLLLVLKKIICFINTIYKNIFRRRRNFAKRYGVRSWALVTGSSDGIGKAIAHSLAKQGFNIILSARTQKKLQLARQQILNACPQIQVQILPLDYSKSSTPNYLQSSLSKILQLELSILVNNVGVDVLDYYHNLSQQQIINLINVNCCTVSIMNRIIIPKFVERFIGRKMRSAIVNVGSVAGEVPLALHNVYSASKAFVDTLSRSLSYQYAKAIDIICLNPSQVSTPMTYHKKQDILTILPKDCAEGLLNDLGHDRVTNGHISHKIQSSLYKSIPQSIYNFFFLNYIGPDFIKERQKAIKNLKKI